MKTLLVAVLGVAGTIGALYFGGIFDHWPTLEEFKEEYLHLFKTHFWIAAIITTAVVCFVGMILRASFLKISFVAFMIGNVYFAAIYFLDEGQMEELDEAIVNALVPYFGAAAPVIFAFFTSARLFRGAGQKKK